MTDPAIPLFSSLPLSLSLQSLSLPWQVGDIVSVIDMPPKEDTTWWRGKHGFQVCDPEAHTHTDKQLLCCSLEPGVFISCAQMAWHPLIFCLLIYCRLHKARIFIVLWCLSISLFSHIWFGLLANSTIFIHIQKTKSAHCSFGLNISLWTISSVKDRHTHCIIQNGHTEWLFSIVMWLY